MEFKRKDRFKNTYWQHSSKFSVWVDSETGVNYLCLADAAAIGLTVLVDKDGKPVVTPVEE